MAVSSLHEGLLELVRDRPEFVAELLARFLDLGIPRFTEARLAEAALTQLVPVESHADAVVLLVEDRPVFGIIVEVQLRQDDRKAYTWPLYATAARARHECPFVLVVITPESSVARWAARPIEVGGGSLFRPLVMGPERIPKVTDPAVAARDPQLAVLSVAAHGRASTATAVEIALAVSGALLDLPDPQQRALYLALVEGALSDAAKEVLKMLPQTEKFFSESQRLSYDRGIAEGKERGIAEGKERGIAEGKERGIAEGEAKAVLMILARRGLVVREDQQRQILECSDLSTLDRWLDRALSAGSVDELLA